MARAHPKAHARFLLYELNYLTFALEAHMLLYKRRICKTDITESQLQSLIDIIEEKEIQRRVVMSYLMYF
jgi:hypothetical protein